MDTVQSSAILSTDYTQFMDITFKNGKTYRYFGVPNTLYQEFQNSESKGRFFQDNINERYRFQKVSDGPK